MKKGILSTNSVSNPFLSSELSLLFSLMKQYIQVKVFIAADLSSFVICEHTGRSQLTLFFACFKFFVSGIVDSCRRKGTRLLTTNYCVLIVPGKLYPLLMLELFVEFGMIKVYISFNSCFFPLLTLIGPC